MREKLMPNPIFRILRSIQLHTLNIYVFVQLVKIDVTNRGGIIRKLVGDADGFEEGRCDEVDVLARVGEEAHLTEDGEARHCARIVVARKTAVAGVEARWYV